MATGPLCGGGGENLQKEDRGVLWLEGRFGLRKTGLHCVDVKVLKLGPVESWYLYPLPFIWALAEQNT